MNKLLIFILLSFSSFSLIGQQKDELNYLSILKRASNYSNKDNGQFPKFIYQSSNDSALIALRKNYKLDSIAGFGNEASRLLNLLHWVHNTVHHDGEHDSGIKNINANSIITSHLAVSCGELATTLNDCYLAMGCPSRKIYCFPKDSLRNDNDSHVINMVYLSSKRKWIWVDPTNDAYVMNEKGELLSIEEVRERLIENKPLILNPDANWNHKSSREKEEYLDKYMAKNLYRLYCPLKSEYDYETSGRNKRVIYVNLIPLEYSVRDSNKTDKYYTSNPGLFWKKP